MKGNGQDIHELIRIEAYLLSEKAGHPSHMHDYFWAQAEAIVRQRAATVGLAVKAAGKKKAAKPKAVVAAKKPAAKPELTLDLEPVPAAAKPKKPAAAAKKTPTPAAKKGGAKRK